MQGRLVTHILKPFGQIRQNEAPTVLLMFLYSFLVMTAFNVIKPVTPAKFIEKLGSENLPYAQLAAGALIGFVMAAFSWVIARFPRRWCLVFAQGGIAILLLVFWILFHIDSTWVAVAFQLLGLILGVLLISQFWTLANVVFDPRQAKRLFGFIGGGASLGGILGSFLASTFADRIHTENLLLFSAGFMFLSALAVSLVVRREGIGEEIQDALTSLEKGVSGKAAMQLLRESKHLRMIALVISFAAIGAVIIEQQINMAATVAKGPEAKDAITVFLANVLLVASAIGFLVQIFLTSRIYQKFGIGFALLMLPVSLGSTAVVMLLVTATALWAPALARVLDQSLRHTIDKTTREVLYMPLPSAMKFAAKPFIDVTVDCFAKSIGALLLLFLIQPWGLHLTWQKLGFVSIVLTGVWIFTALRARHEYKEAFRRSINSRVIMPAEVTAAVADPTTIETLTQELSSQDEQRVLYAIEFLESLDKRQLISPLLLYNKSPAVRARALLVMCVVGPEISTRWLPAVHAMLNDPDPNVRSAAVSALASMQNRQASDLVRPLLKDANPRISLTAAMILAGSGQEEDAAVAEEVLGGLVSDTRESAASVRRDFAVAVRHVPIPHFRRLLIPLLNDPNPEVAEEAMCSTRKLGATDFVFVSTLISLLRNRRQKSSARELLVGFGEPVIPILGHFLRDPDEDIWIRRHIPATIARIPSQNAMNILVEALDEKDGFLRFHVIAALERIHRIKPELLFDRQRIESLIQEECAHYKQYRELYRVLFESQKYSRGTLLARATAEKMKRGLDRIYRILSLLYPWKDIAAARHTIEHGDKRARAGTLEYLDNILAGGLRRTLIPLFEDALPKESRLPVGGSRSNEEAAVIRLINDEDQVVASSAIYFVWQYRLLNYAGEIERVLEKRDARDRHVLETATWVLHELRSPLPKRRLIWLEPLPTVDLANQMHTLPLFSSVTVDEIFRICETGRQVQSEPGRLLCEEASVPENVHFLLNGCVRVTRSGSENRHIEAPAVLAFQEVLEEQPMTESVQTTEMSVCLTLTSGEVQELMSDNSNLVPGLFRMLCRDTQAVRVLVNGFESLRSALPVDGGLNPIEKGLVLKAIPIFSRVSPDEIIGLASIANEMSLSAGSDLFNESDRPAIYTLISGELSLEKRGESSVIAGSSDVIGIYETLAGIDFDFHARVRSDGIALRIDREDLFDLLTQRSVLLQQVFSALFRNQPIMDKADQ